MTKSGFINRVLLIMNEAGMFDPAGNSYLGADTAQVDRHIEGSYVDAWRRCVKVMPRAWFKNKSFDDSPKEEYTSNGTGFIVLPDDFYLLTALKMEGWQKAVYEASIENEKTASIQSNEWTRGSTIRPVCTISNKLRNTVVKQVFNYYSLPKGLIQCNLLIFHKGKYLLLMNRKRCLMLCPVPLSPLHPGRGYSPNLRIRVTVTFGSFVVSCQLVRFIRLSIGFLFVKPRFRYCFFSPKRHRSKLAGQYRVRR
ncbi:MAG: hypothetical protein LBK65_09185 [Tannerellaceae bacterium]|jgi:hypothetical protein|nr:hypothetical protein [Tannerellaceae bacterium]